MGRPLSGGGLRRILMCLPRWLRLGGIAPISRRTQTTASINRAINGSGGYLERATPMSDLQTTFTVFDLPPKGVQRLRRNLVGIEGLQLDKGTHNVLTLAEETVLEKEKAGARLPQ